ncbi:MAG: hypothetical protein VZQ80_03240 [Lachnospiraceae bacterium]|nr:hypothetical protein [Lachnospiraceae bacterium]
MPVQMKKWGNSMGLRVTKEMLNEAGISPDDPMTLEIKKGQFIFTTVHRRLSLEERIEKYGPIEKAPAVDWGKDRGREVWK